MSDKSPVEVDDVDVQVGGDAKKSTDAESKVGGSQDDSKGAPPEEEEEDLLDEPDGHPDGPLQVVTISTKGDRFILREKNLKCILERVEKINCDRVIIVSVVGAFRTGKSFLLDLFIRYLNHMESLIPVEETPGEESSDDEIEYDSEEDAELVSRDVATDGLRNRRTATAKKKESAEPPFTSPSMAAFPGCDRLPTWLRHGGQYLHEGRSSSTQAQRRPGFLWRPGKERTTTGIWMSGKPYRVKLASGEVVGCVLMDTQGMFDGKTTKELTAAIFGLSTLISSYQIYNVSKQIQEDKLDQLNYFTHFSKTAMREFQRLTSDGGDTLTDTAPTFQKIEFLVRDYQHFEDEEDADRCLSEMDAYLQEQLEERYHDDGTREQIKAAFEDISCFLLPHPGKALTKKDFDGDIMSVDSTFVTLFNTYVTRVFQDGLVTKKVQGREAAPRALFEYIKSYVNIFKDGKLPQAMTLVHAIAATNNMVTKEQCLEDYKERMEKACSGTGALEDDELQRLNESFMKQSLAHFDKTATFGESLDITKTRQSLVSKMEAIFAQLQEKNSLKIQAGLVVYIWPTALALSAFILDRISDFTCDSWSTTCQTFSRVSSASYIMFSFWLCYQFFLIYRSEGSVAATASALALFKAVVEHMQHAWDQILHIINDDKKKLKDGDRPPLSRAASDFELVKRKTR